MTALIVRMVARRVVGAPLRSIGFVFLFAVSVVVLTTAVALIRTVEETWDRAHRETRGGDVQVSSFTSFSADTVRTAPGVAAAGPFEARVVSAHVEGRAVGVALWAMPPLAEVDIDRPVVVSGRWPERPHEVALERSFARAVGATTGSRLEVPSHDGPSGLDVSAVVVSTRTPPYPTTAPGSAFLAPGTPLTGFAGDRLYQASIRFDDDATPSSVMELLRLIASPTATATTAVSIRRDMLASIRPIQVVLMSFGIMLLVGVAALVAMQASARLLDVARRVGQLRVAGVGPCGLVIALAAENVVLSAAGAFVGVAGGLLMTPVLASRVALALGSVQPTPTPLGAGFVVLGVVGFTALVSGLSVLRWLHAPIAPAARGAGLGGRRPSRLAALVLYRGRSPVVALAAKEATGHPLRAILLGASVALAVMAGVAALAMEASFARAAREPGFTVPGAPGPSFAVVGENADEAQLRTVVYALQAALVVVALGAVAFGVATSIRERVRDHAILRAVGVSPGQLLIAVSASSGLIAALGAAAGLPLGFGFFRMAYGMADGSSDDIAWPSAVSCAGVLVVAVAAAVVVAAVAASRSRSAALSAPS